MTRCGKDVKIILRRGKQRSSPLPVGPIPRPQTVSKQTLGVSIVGLARATGTILDDLNIEFLEE